MPELTDMTGEGKPRPSGGGHGLTQPNSAARRPAGRLDAYSSIATTFFDIGGEDELEDAFLNAAREGDYDKIEGILKRRNESLVNIDARDGETGNTALIWAAKRGHVTIVQLLLRSGADITLRNFEGHTAVEVASPQIRQILLDSVDKGGPHRNLLQAAWQGNAKLVKKILTETKHVDINCRNADGLTPLLLVTRDVQLFERVGNRIMRGYEATEVVNELLKYRADPNVVDEEGRTPLHHAASSKANTAGRMVKQLLNQGCEIEVRDRRHFTAIHCACQSGNVEVVVALLEGGSDANLRGYAGSTPLHISMAIPKENSSCPSAVEDFYYNLAQDGENPDDRYFPIAIVGIGCRMPGDVNDVEDFKKVMEEGTDVISEVPEDRWSLDKYWHPDPHNVGTHANKRAGFCKDVHDFDHTFYNISPREAANMDVMQRHILEVTQEALDDGGIPSEKLPRDTGVYVGICLMDHGFTVIEDAKCMNAYTHTGTAHSVAANRVSFAYDIRGPSVAIDTACAASLTSMHYAAFALWNKECPVALVTASNTLMVPEVTVGFNALGVLSPEGISCPFSANAKGYVRSEGTGSLVMKPLSEAIKDGDHVYCTVRASWLAHNGYSLSITMPSTDAQAEMMKKTYKVFGLRREHTDFIEAHGTGTPVGDPLEADGIARAFTGDDVKRNKPLAVGSSKSNFGHMEGAAGMVQVIKSALMLENRYFLPNINFGTPNPAIDCEKWNIYVPEKIIPYEEKKPMRIGVNTFGFGGALAHMLLEEYQPVQKPDHKKGNAGWQFGPSSQKGMKLPIPLSAKSGAALKGLCEKWMSFESSDDAQEVVSYLATHRSHYSTRLVVFADSGDDFRRKMAMYINKEAHEDIVEGTLPAHVDEKQICFIFPGQGQQSFDMGRSLYRDEPVFRKAVDDCDAIYKSLSGKSFCHTYNLFVQLEPGKTYNPDVVNEIQVSQPAILFLQIGLYELMIHWGIKPDALVGHSLGEVAAAYASGAINLEEAVTVQYNRAEQQVKLDGTGSMAALRVSAEKGMEMCKEYEDLYVACNNAQESITIAGSKPVVKQICADNPGNAKELRVKCAFHTPHMDPLETDFLKSMEGKMRNGKPTGTPWYSTVTGSKYEGPANAQYFWDNIRGRVEFLDAVLGVMRDFPNVLFLELAGSATLLSCIRAIAKGEDYTPSGMVPCGQRKIDDRTSTLRALATLHSMAIPMDWGNITDNCGHWMRLPLYAWQHSTFRYEAEGMRSRRLDLEDRSYKGLFGVIRLEQLPFLRDHIINGQLVFPRSGFVEYMLQHNYDMEAIPALSNVKFDPQFITMSEEVDLNGMIPERKQFFVENVQVQNGHRSIIVCDGKQYAQGDVVPLRSHIPKSFNINMLKSSCKTALSADDFYEVFGEMGVEYADFMRFKLVEEAYVGDGEILACLHPVHDKRERIYTPVLDATFTIAMAAHVNNTSLLTPSKIGSVRMTVPQLPRKERMYVYAKLNSYDSHGISSDMYILNYNGEVLAEIHNFEAVNTINARTAQVDLTQCVYTREWQPVTACMPSTDTMLELFSQKSLQKLYPHELVAVENAERHNQVMKEVCSAYARNAVTKTPENQRHQKMMRYATRLQQMADTVPSSMSYEELPKVLEQLEKDVPEYHQEIKMIKRMGEILPESLKDPKTALVELFTEEMMAAYFIDSITTRIYYKMLGDAVKKAVEHARQTKKIVRVAEVGGRLGGMTKYILPCIEEYLKDGSVEYCFTDINVAFFGIVQETLKAYPNVHYQQFDPENDIVSQNFVPNSFDLVLCLDTLHCTENAVHATSNIRDLLCENGWLAVMESTNNHNTPEIIFGAFDLCWVFEDDRVDRCWLGQQGWTSVMENAGFSNVVATSTPNEFYHSLLFGHKTNLELAYELNQPKNAPTEMDIETDVLQEEGETKWIVLYSDDESLARSLKDMLPMDTDITNVEKFSSMQKTLSECSRPTTIVYFWDETDNDLEQVLNFVQTCQQLGERPKSNAWVITRGVQYSLKASQAAGFIRAAISEVQNIPLFMADIKVGALNGQISDLFETLKNHSHTDREMSLQNSTKMVPRVIRQSLDTKLPGTGADWRVEVASPKSNLLDQIDFHAFSSDKVAENEIRVAVKASAINKKDLVEAKSKDKTTRKMFGLECAGIVEDIGSGVHHLSAGDQVIAFGAGAISSSLTTNSNMVFKKPSELSFVDAAGLGLAYSTAYYTLSDRAQLQQGETVLLQNACSGEGQAMLQIASHIGAKVICVANNDSERKFLESQSSVSNVTSADKLYDNVMGWTNERGVDVAVTLYEDTIEKSVQCLAHAGRLCHIGDQLSNTTLLLETMRKNISVHSIQITALMEQNPNKFGNVMNTVLTLIEQKAISSVSVNVRDISDAVQSLTLDNPIIGDIVLDIPSDFCPNVEPCIDTFKSDATYLITGSSGGVGQEVARWMADKGAKHIALVSKNGHKSWFQKDTIRYLEDQGGTVYDIRADISKEKGVRQIFSCLKQNGSPSIKGVFHLAGINQYIQLEDLTADELIKDLNARATSAKLLNDVTADLNLDLDYFVCISSSKATWGCPGLASFCASCSYLDQLAVIRRAQGFKSLSVQAGWLRGAGWLEDRTRNADLQQFYNSCTLHVSEFLAILHKLLDQPDLPPVVMITNEALNGHDQVATKLLERGADVTMVDDSGLTPVDVAKTKKVKVALKQAWTEATQGKIEKNLRPVRLSSGEGVRKSREGLPKQRKGGQVIFDSLATSSNLSMSSSFEAITPRKAAMSVLQRQLINSERARQAEEQMKREVIEARYSRHNRHYSTNNSSPTSRLAPLKSHTPRRKDVKFAPDTKTHDGHHHGMGQRAPSTGKHIPLHKTSSDPTKLSSQGCHFVPVTVLGLELDENLQDIKMRHLAQGASSLSKKRNLSDSAANSPIYMDQLGDELCLRGRSPSKASLATMSEDWETTSFSTTVSALSSSPPYNNHINPRTPSAGSEHSRLRVPDAITEENYNHYHVLDLDRMQLTNQTRTPVQSDGVYPTSRTLLPPTPISQQDDYLSVTDMRVTDMSQDFSGASSKESSPRSSYDSDEEDHVNEQIRLAVPDLTQLTRSKSILRQGNFNIESTRVTPKPPKEENNLRKSDDSGCPEDKDSGSNRSSVGSNGSSTGSSSSGTASSSCPQNNMDVKKFKSKKELDIKRNVSPNSAEVASAKLKAASRDNAVKVKQATSSAVTPVGCPGPIQRLTPGVENQHNSELSYTSKLIHVQECPSDNVSNNISGKCNDTNGLNSSAQKNKVTIHSTALNDVLKNEDDEIVNEKPDSGGKSGRKAPPRPTEKPQIQHSNNNNVRTHSVTMAAPTQPASTPPVSGKEHNSVEKNQSQMANKRPPITPRSTSGNKVSDSNSHISRNPTPRTAIQHNKSDSSNPSSSPAQSRRPSLSPGRSGHASPGQKSRQKSPGRTGQVSPNRTRDKSPASPRQNRQQPPSSRPTSQSQKNRPVVPPRPATWNNNFKKVPVQKCTSGKADSTFKASVSTAQNTKTVLPKQNAKTPPARPPAPQASKNSTNSNVKNNDTENKGTVGGDVTLPKGKLQRSGSNSEFTNEKPQSGYSGIASKQPKMPSLAAGESADNGVIGTPPRVVKPEDIVSNKNSEANIKSPDSKGKETYGSNKKDKTGGKLSVEVSEQKVMSGEKTAISENSPSVRKIVEHKGPVICDPFEAIRAQLRQQENQVQQENAKANRLRSAKPRAGVNSATRKGSKDVRQGSAGKKKKAEKKPPADAVRIVRPKSGKKGKGKKKKKSAEKTRLGISDQDDLTNVAFIGGLGWHIQTDCDMNQVKPVKFRPPVADWSDEESEIISARVKPNYVHSPRSNDGDEAEERSKSAKTREKLVKKADQTGGVLLQLPGAISEGEYAAEDTEEEVEDEEVEEEEEEEEEIEGTEDVEEEVVFDHTLKESGSKSGTPRGARLTVTPGKTITISPRSGGRSPRRSPRSIHRGASRGAISPNSPLRSPKGHGVSGRERSPRVSGKNLEVLLMAETKAVDKSTTNKVETPATSETVVKTVSKEKLNDEVGRVEDAVCDGSESESSLNENKESVGTHNKDSKNSYNDKGVSSVTGEQQSEEHLVDQSTEKEANAKAQKSKCVKSFSHTKAPISKKKEDEELEDAINEILQTTPNPSLTLSLKSQSSVHSKSEVKERSSRSPEEARSQFEQQLQKSLDGKSFREVPVQETEDLDLDKLHEDFDIGEDEKMELERLMDSLKKMDLMVSLPLDVDSGEEESTPRDENETTPRQDDTASKKPQHRKPVNKPPIPPKSSTSPKQTDKPAKSPSGGGKAPRVEKLHMPGTSFVAEKSPRFVRKQDSWKENKQARPVLPPEENDGRIGLHRRDSDQMSEASNNSEAISLPSTMGDQDSMVPSDSRVVTSRLGRRSANSRAASAMTTDSSFDDTIDTIQWKRGNMLGQGAYGKVWCGLTNCGELIAVKQIELNMADMDKAEVEYEKIQEEVELLKTLKHRNIVGYLGTSLEDNIVSIFMQFVPGGSLASVLARFGALEEEVFCYYTKQILEGVAYLHANNVIHRDIKGGNIMLMQNGVIKLIDFGCAKRLCLNVGSTGSTSTSQNRLLKSMRGTPYWMAPEVVREIGYGTKSDIWSIGCTMFEMATRKPPWADMSPMAAIFAIGSDRPIPRLPEKFSEPACDFVDKCLTRDQNIRPSASELLSHLFIARKRKRGSRVEAGH